MAATRRAVLIAGPTASGKSALALALAEKIGGEIINTDSMQIYQGLRIVTARPDTKDEMRVPHHLYGVAAPADPWSVGRWLTAAGEVMAQIHQAGRIAIFVGGTGLYFSALEHGLNDIPAIPDDIRATLRQRLEDQGLGALRGELEACDPALAKRIEPTDRQRILRGLEVFEATGRPLSAWQNDKSSPSIVHDVTLARVLLMPERAGLYQRCDTRFSQMLAQGLVEEVAAFRQRQLAPGVPAMKALGVPQITGHLDGACTLDEAIAATRTETRRYAKRQMTWFRNRMGNWPVFDAADQAAVWDAVAGALDLSNDIPA